MKRSVLCVITLICISAVGCSQNTITGSFPALSNQQIKLVGFEGFNTYTIDSVKASENGNFHSLKTTTAWPTSQPKMTKPSL